MDLASKCPVASDSLFIVLRHADNRVGDMNNLAGILRAAGNPQVIVIDAKSDSASLPFEGPEKPVLISTTDFEKSAQDIARLVTKLKNGREVVFLSTGAKDLSRGLLQAIGGASSRWIDLASDVNFSWKQKGEMLGPSMSFSLSEKQQSASSKKIPYLPSRWSDNFLERQFKAWADNSALAGGNAIAAMVGGMYVHRDLQERFYAKDEIRSTQDLLKSLQTSEAKERPLFLSTFQRTEDHIIRLIDRELRNRHPDDDIHHPKNNPSGSNPLPGAFLHAATIIVPGESLSGLSDVIRIAEFRQKKGLAIPRVVITRPVGAYHARPLHEYLIDIGIGSFNKNSMHVLPPNKIINHVSVEQIIGQYLQSAKTGPELKVPSRHAVRQSNKLTM